MPDVIVLPCGCIQEGFRLTQCPEHLAKPTPQDLVRPQKRKSKVQEWRFVCELVDRRDDRKCRCCGRRDKLMHHAHIVRRRTSHGRMDTLDNVLLLCGLCHSLEHTSPKQIAIIGTNANNLIGFEIHEAAVVEVFGRKPLPPHVHIVTTPRIA